MPIGTEFRYTGYLLENGTPANGNYDFEGVLYDDEFGGNQVGQPKSQNSVPAVNGVFQFDIDFGAVFDGTKLWLQLRVKPSNQNNWTIMSPRQLLTATPYALFAPTAGSVANNGVLGPMIKDGTLTATKIDSGQVVKSLNDLHDDVKLKAGKDISITKSGNELEIAALSGGSSFWSLTGNSGTIAGPNFLGTLDDEPLELHVDGQRAFRLAPANVFTANGDTLSINVVGGFSGNQVSSGVVGGTIAGGGYAFTGLIPEVGPNSVFGDYGTIGGGFSNRADNLAMVGGGRHNFASKGGFIGGGASNTIDHSVLSTIGGGARNVIEGLIDHATGMKGTSTHSTIGGGFYNWVGGDYSTIPGGYANQVLGQFSLAAGRNASADHDRCFAWNASTSGPDQFVVAAAGGMRLWGDFFCLGGNIYFNNPHRQKIFLAREGKPEGIGIQDNTVYFRAGAQPGSIIGSPVTADGFVWYGGGSHVNTADDPGPGGMVYMSLRHDQQGICCKVIAPAPRLWVRGGIDADQDITAPVFRKFSDRNRKTNFEELDKRMILDQVLTLPITRWSYTNSPAIRHIGAMAQDFSPLFGVGTDDEHIDLGDENGVALVALQGLNLKMEEQLSARSADIETLRQRNDALELRVAELERVVATLIPGRVPGAAPAGGTP